MQFLATERLFGVSGATDYQPETQAKISAGTQDPTWHGGFALEGYGERPLLRATGLALLWREGRGQPLCPELSP